MIQVALSKETPHSLREQVLSAIQKRLNAVLVWQYEAWGLYFVQFDAMPSELNQHYVNQIMSQHGFAE